MNPTKTYIGALLIAAAAVAFWMLALPAYDQVVSLRDALSQREEILQNRTAIVSNIKSLDKQYTEHSAEIQRFSNIVPASKDTAELVSTIQAMASQNGLTLTGVAMGSQNGSKNKDPYQTQSMDISVTGKYLSFRSFLSNLESNLRIMDVTNLDISQTTGDSSDLNFRIKANAYYLP
ncbi:MAG TPA: type 4a pilus biogenesis protein PilO [Candidatus Paceibacterota bacterium]|nr:type 4a pilus biogenesis protein PilO [Candidatus Paceibacterota bacterium]